MIRSRLRRPTSKSSTAVLWPRMARPVEKLALEVVLPTPPLPDVTTIILATNNPFQISLELCSLRAVHGSDRIDRVYIDSVSSQTYLRRSARHFHRETILERAVHAGDRHQFRLHGQRKDARLGIARGAGQRAAIQRGIHMDAAVGVSLGGASSRVLPLSRLKPCARMASCISAGALRTATAFKRYFFSRATREAQSTGMPPGGKSATSSTARSSSKKSATPPVMSRKAASSACVSALCTMAETATTVEILISIGFCDGLLDINIYQSETAAGQMFRTATMGAVNFLHSTAKKSASGAWRVLFRRATPTSCQKTRAAPRKTAAPPQEQLRMRPDGAELDQAARIWRAAATILRNAASVSVQPRVFKPQSGFTHKLAGGTTALAFCSKRTMSTVEGARGEWMSYTPGPISF